MGIQTAANNSRDVPVAFLGSVADATYEEGNLLRDFVQALARNQARIDHQQTVSAANDNFTRH
jgi:hypothetical protein